jgi:hypothetical protein
MAFRLGKPSPPAGSYVSNARTAQEPVACLAESRMRVERDHIAPAPLDGARRCADSPLAHTLVFEAVDCLSQASDLADDEGYASLCRHVQELTVLAERLARSSQPII